MTKEQETELLPCPFNTGPTPCNHAALSVVAFKRGTSKSYESFASCDDCGAHGPVSYASAKEDARTLAVSSWNRRPSPSDAVEGEGSADDIEAVRAGLKSILRPIREGWYPDDPDFQSVSEAVDSGLSALERIRSALTALRARLGEGGSE